MFTAYRNGQQVREAKTMDALTENLGEVDCITYHDEESGYYFEMPAHLLKSVNKVLSIQSDDFGICKNGIDSMTQSKINEGY